MFKNSEESTTPDLFKGVTQHLSGTKLKELEDEKSWQNQFYREITSRVDEEIFAPLYASGVGRPNASIRQMVAMILLKEGHDWTDEQLYEQCRYNLRVMRALGLTNIDENVPVESTYYDFKAKLVDHFERTEEDLFSELFRQITTEQVVRYKVRGHEIRLDSKLVHSNIRNFTRLQRIIQAIQVFVRSLGEGHCIRLKKKGDRAFLDQIMKKKPEQHTYGLQREEKKEWLERIGFLLRKLIHLYDSRDSAYYQALKKMFEEQYEYEERNDKPPTPRDPGEVSSESIQSVHDPEAAYRSKGHGIEVQKVSGYSANITESCGEDEPHLITDVQVGKATISDDAFLIPAIQNTESITSDTVKDVWSDGGYDSVKNRNQFGEWKNKSWHLSKIKGSHTYDFSKGPEGQVIVTDLKTNDTYEAQLAQNGKYRIPSRRSRTRYVYFKQETVSSRLALNKVIAPRSSINKRANVESTIHQVFHTLKGNKARYRGQSRITLFVFARCFWVNLKRIKKWAILNPLERVLSYLFTSAEQILGRFWILLNGVRITYAFSKR